MAIEVNRLYLTFIPRISETRNMERHPRDNPLAASCHVERKSALSAVERVETSLTVAKFGFAANNSERFLDYVSPRETALGMTKESGSRLSSF
jgi:hypothetical protein